MYNDQVLCGFGYEQGAGGVKDDDEQSANAADLASTIDKPTFKSCQNNKRLLFHAAFCQSWLKSISKKYDL